MILGAFGAIAFTYPMALLLVQQPGQTQQSTYSALGFAVETNYGYRPDLLGLASLEMNLGVRSRNVLTWGANLGAKYYVLGGLAAEEQGRYLSSYSSSKFSVFVTGGMAQRSFSFPDANSGERFIADPSADKVTSSGIFLGGQGSIGFESLITERLRLGLAADMIIAAFGADNIGITILSGKFSVIYQP